MIIPVEVRLAYRRGMRYAKTLLFVAAGLSAPLTVQSFTRRDGANAGVGVQIHLDVYVQLEPRIFGVTRIFGHSPP